MILKVKRTKYAGAKEEYIILDKNNNLVKIFNLEKEKEFSKFNLNYNITKKEKGTVLFSFFVERLRNRYAKKYKQLFLLHLYNSIYCIYFNITFKIFQ